MKEQISVDKENLDRLRKLETENAGLRTFIKYLYSVTDKPIAIELNIDELLRLKRPDENRKKKIADYERCINGVFGKSYLEKIIIMRKKM